MRAPSRSRPRSGLWKKLERIRRNPGVAVAYHAREHGLTDRPGFVLVQGRASFPATPDRAWLESITPEWERFLGPRSGGIAGRMLDVYYWQRVPITIEVERVVAYPDDRAEEEPEVFGTPLAGPPPPQKRSQGRDGPARGHRQGGCPGTRTPAPHAARLVRRGRHAGGDPGDRAGAASSEGIEPARPARIGPDRAAGEPGSRRTRSSRGWSARSSASTRAGSRATGRDG